jgi:D-glycerate 3-kinase
MTTKDRTTKDRTTKRTIKDSLDSRSFNQPLLAQEQQLLNDLQLPESYANTVNQVVVPLCERLTEVYRLQQGPLVLGINGPQGSGKSTLAAFVQARLRAEQDLSVVVISLDDLYLGRQQRQQLARDIHPLLQTRGVPGTHDIDLGVDTVQQLLQAGPEHITAIPRFDKATDDRCPPCEWEQHKGPVDIILLEGWCLGARPQPAAALQDSINALEENEDPKGLWRRYVNRCLAEDYPRLFGLLDQLVYLAISDFEQIYQWRCLQEQKLKAARHSGMTERELTRFIQHFERLTRHMMADLPSRADQVFAIERRTGTPSG